MTVLHCCRLRINERTELTKIEKNGGMEQGIKLKGLIKKYIYSYEFVFNFQHYLEFLGYFMLARATFYYRSILGRYSINRVARQQYKSSIDICQYGGFPSLVRDAY